MILHFGRLVGQNMTFNDITLCSRILLWPVFTVCYCFVDKKINRLIEKIIGRVIINEYKCMHHYMDLAPSFHLVKHIFSC